MLHYCLHSLERDEVAPIGSYTLAVASPFIELGSLPTNVPRFLPTCIARLESGTKRTLRGECLKDDSSFFRTWSRHVYLKATWKSCHWLKKSKDITPYTILFYYQVPIIFKYLRAHDA